MPLRWGQADSEQILSQHGAWLALGEGEAIEFAAKTRRDFVIFTDRRMVITDTQGLMNKKTEYRSVPYRAISRWSVESAGKGWRDGADLKVWLGAQEQPTFSVELQKDESAQDLMSLLSRHAM